MKQYIWFHPLYIKDTLATTIEGQKQNALNNNYILLMENELHIVHGWDHLTIVGHSTAPEGQLADEDAEIDTGLYIQGENAEQCVERLQKAGLRVPPKILSLECCRAAVENGLAQMLSKHSFFENSLIESTNGSVGRNPGKVKWSGMPVDCFGRVLFNSSCFHWIFFHGGKVITEHQHGDYKLQDILQTVLPKNFHDTFFAHYEPGFFGGRAGRHCWFGQKMNLEQATVFAEEDLDSATAAALEMVMNDKSLPPL